MTLEKPHAPPDDVLVALTRASERYAVPLRLLVGVAWTESRFDRTAVSSAGAQGLMQLMPDTARGLGVDAFNVDQAAMGAARFLAHLRAQFGDWGLALAAYNWGPGNVSRHTDPASWPGSVQRYVATVVAAGGAAPLPFQGDVTVVQVPSGVQSFSQLLAGRRSGS